MAQNQVASLKHSALLLSPVQATFPTTAPH